LLSPAQSGFTLHEEQTVNKNRGWFVTHVWRPLSFVRGWFLVAVIAAAFNISSAVISMLVHVGVVRESLTITLITGFGCALAWFNMLRYFESFTTYYTLILALRKGLPGVTRLLVSSMPILLGYTMFGLVVFGDRSDNFDTFDHSFAALFSTINGDSLYARFIPLADQQLAYTIIARFYEYSFVCIACYAIVNIFIAIIQESYEAARKQEVRDTVATELARIRKHEEQLRDIVQGSDSESDNGNDGDSVSSSSSSMQQYDTDAEVRVELHDVSSSNRSRSGTGNGNGASGGGGRNLRRPVRQSSTGGGGGGLNVDLLQDTLSALQSSQHEIATLEEGVRATHERINALSAALQDSILQASAARQPLVQLR
jgi:Polycystin cation channel